MTTQRRHPGGRPSGGEFAARQRSEAETALSAAEDPPLGSNLTVGSGLAMLIEREASLVALRPHELSIDSEAAMDILRAIEFERPTTNEDAESLLDELEDGSINSEGARALLWNVLSAEWEVPKVYAQTLTRREALAARQEVLGLGGVNAVCATYLRTGVIDRGASAITAPFGLCSPDTTYSVCSLLASRSHIANKLWESALLAASAPQHERAARAPHTSTV